MGRKIKRWNILHPDQKDKYSYIEKCFVNKSGPVVVSTDYVRLYAEQLREFMPKPYITLGTDGYGRSDSRAKLRSFFEVDRYHVVISALSALRKLGVISKIVILEA